MSTNGENRSQQQSNEQQQERYEQNILPIHTAPGQLEEYEEYFTYDKAKLKALSYYDCALICTRLIQYGIYIQRCYNRDQSRIRYLQKQVKKIVCKTSHQYPGRWEHQEEAAIQDNVAAEAYSNELLQLQQRSDRINNISLSIKTLADQFRNLQFAKKQERQDNG